MNSDVVVALTMGDPAGIGPEIIAKLFAESDRAQSKHAIVVGDEAIMSREISALDLPIRLNTIPTPGDADFSDGVLNLIPATNLRRDLPQGVISEEAGAAAYRYVARAVELAQRSEVLGICTAPIHKESLRAAGFSYPGHTEILADLMRAPDCAMMLLTPELRTILVTIHMPLIEAIDSLSVESELRTIRIADNAMRKIGIRNPRIAVAGVNPHAGEGGLFGKEEINIISPAIRRAQQEGINVTGPHPGDTVFMNARRGCFDIVVAQFHDQGLIPVKLLGFDQGVNFTAGLPVVRTSVDHGTAFDIVGKGKADPSSLRAALKLAFELINLQRRNAL